MHESASTFVDNWWDLIARILGDLDLDKLAFSTRALRRRRGVRNALALLRLALARGPGGLSLRDAAAWAHMAQVAELTDASLNDRLHQSCEFLAAVAAAMLQAKTPGCCFRWPGRVLRISDGSCVSKPGSKGTDWRGDAVYDLGAGDFSHFELTDKHGAEALDRGAAIRGEIRLADRNYSNAKGLRRLRESVGKTGDADYLVRLRWSSLRLRGADDKKFDLAEHLRNMPADKLTDDLVVSVEGAGAPMRTRIIIRRKSEEAAQAERQRLLSQARKKSKTLDPRSLLAAGFVVLATSLDAETYPADELLAMYRQTLDDRYRPGMATLKILLLGRGECFRSLAGFAANAAGSLELFSRPRPSRDPPGPVWRAWIRRQRCGTAVGPSGPRCKG